MDSVQAGREIIALSALSRAPVGNMASHVPPGLFISSMPHYRFGGMVKLSEPVD